MRSFRRLNKELALIDLVLAGLEIPKFYGQNEKFMGWFSKVYNKSLLVTTSVTERSSRWLFQDCEVVYFNGGRIINLREERKEKRR